MIWRAWYSWIFIRVHRGGAEFAEGLWGWNRPTGQYSGGVASQSVRTSGSLAAIPWSAGGWGRSILWGLLCIAWLAGIGYAVWTAGEFGGREWLKIGWWGLLSVCGLLNLSAQTRDSRFRKSVALGWHRDQHERRMFEIHVNIFAVKLCLIGFLMWVVQSGTPSNAEFGVRLAFGLTIVALIMTPGGTLLRPGRGEV
jgi:hypothetical protein